MNSYKSYFASCDDQVWLNAASEGPLPVCAKDALYEVTDKKMRPHELTLEYFAKVPLKLKQSIGQLINVNHRDVILGNSASYGIHLLANGIVWKTGDEVLVMQNDFPSDILPWLALEEQGVMVRQISASDRIVTIDELKESITDQTRVVCLPHVHTFSGRILRDVKEIADLCHEHGAKLVLNISQSCGNRPVDVEAMQVDAIVCAGYKWLVGPYGTGFCWIEPSLRGELKLNKAYWVSTMSEEELKSEGALQHKNINSARKLDVFASSSFFNTVPWTASIDMLLDIGIENVQKHTDDLVKIVVDNLDTSKYDFISSVDADQRTALIVITHKSPENNEQIHRMLLKDNFHTAFWKNNIRISPHIYNSIEELEQLTERLNKA